MNLYYAVEDTLFDLARLDCDTHLARFACGNGFAREGRLDARTRGRSREDHQRLVATILEVKRVVSIVASALYCADIMATLCELYLCPFIFCSGYEYAG